MRGTLSQGLPSALLFSDYLKNRGTARSFYAQDYSLESVARFARSRAPLDANHKERLCSVLSQQQLKWGAGQRGVEKLAAGAVAVVTGQQPVLFTGPLFSIFKAITAVRIARHLESEGIAAVPVFWVAAEDHDFKEIEETWVLNRDSKLSRIAVDLEGTEPCPAGWLAFREDVHGAVERCFAELPESEFGPELRKVLEEWYRPGVSPVDAFAGTMAKLFAKTELTFINPLNDDLRVLAQRTMSRAISSSGDIRTALQARNRELSAAGYHEQVRVDDGFTGFFAFKGRARQSVRPQDLQPEMRWSPNVLLRPALQDTLLPTAAYIGGPAEVAYFAQAAAVYQTLGLPMPPIVPRLSGTVAEPRVSRVAEKYGVELEDVFQGRDHLRRMVVGSMDSGDEFERVRALVEAELESLRPKLCGTDATLGGALDTALQKIRHQMEALKGKYVAAAARRDETVERHLETLLNSLFPEKKPQERVLNIGSFAARYGLGIVDTLLERFQLESTDHQVIEL